MAQDQKQPPAIRESREPLNPAWAAARRRHGKDALLGDEPPRLIAVTIVFIAVMLSVLTAVCWSFEYEETVPIVLGPGGEPHTDYRVGYLPATVDVKSGQTVHLEPGSMQSPSVSVEATVTGVSGPTSDGLFIVRVEFPDVAGISQPQNSESQIRGVLVTKKVRLFARLFGVFRNITRGS
jgi:hypothetical protein